MIASVCRLLEKAFPLEQEEEVVDVDVKRKLLPGRQIRLVKPFLPAQPAHLEDRRHGADTVLVLRYPQQGPQEPGIYVHLVALWRSSGVCGAFIIKVRQSFARRIT